jgi:glycosyltransferase involved in cell wall biosynthesis
MSKRVCIIVQNYFEIAPRARSEARCLVEHGYSVDVIALRMRDHRQTEYDLDGTHVVTVPLSKKRAGKWRYVLEYLVFFLMAALLVTWRMIRCRYDVIQVCNLPDFLVFAALIPKLMGAKVVFDMFEIMPEFYMTKYDVRQEHPIIRMLKWQEKLCTRFADQVIVINDPIKELLVARGVTPDKVTVVTNSADDSLFTGEQFASHDRADGRFIMMYHGTLTPLYGLDIALRAFASVRPLLSTAEFWILGDGPERSRLESIAQENGLDEKVKFIGVVPQQDIPKWLTQCDVGVLATRQDQFLDFSFSSKLPEYIVMGKPVIMSRLKTIRYYFSEQALAFFKPHNEADLAKRMVELFENPKRRGELVRQAQREYAKIDWSVMNRRYLNLYIRL